MADFPRNTSVPVLSSEWTGRRVFLTGHTGFKGSWLSLWLQQLGAKLSGYSLAPSTSPSLFEVAEVAEGMDSLTGDVRDAGRMKAELAAFQPEVVFHLAAQSLVRYSYDHPLETYAVNVMGTANLLDAVRACKSVKAVVVITTDKCYENKEWIWPYRENDRLGGHDPYSNSKACAELVVSSFRDSFFHPGKHGDPGVHGDHGVAIATARAGNVIGGGDWAADRLIPDIMRAFDLGVPVAIRNPQSVRPWQHVLEPLRGYLTLANRLCSEGSKFASAWNFGPSEGDAKPVIEIVERMASLWNEQSGSDGAAWKADTGSHVHEAAQLRLDCSKAAEELNWRPILRIDDALQLTAAWYAAKRGGAGMKSFTLNQIADYSRLAGA